MNPALQRNDRRPSANYDVAKLPPYSSLPEPLLQFAADRDDARGTHPLRGLASFGPYSRSGLATYIPQVRVATAGPASGQRAMRELLAGLTHEHQPGDRPDYVPPYPGFAAVFNVGFDLADTDAAHISLPDRLDQLGSTGPPHERVATALAGAVNQLNDVRHAFDLAVVHLPDSWDAGLRTREFDAHDYLKAVGALAGIPTQVINDRAFTFRYRASLAWRLSIACYVKAGGIPWKLAPLPGVPSDTAYIGLAYAFRGDPREARFVTCCSQVFDADGGGMQFVAYDANDPVEDSDQARHNPYLSRDDMRAVLARSLRTYQSRNGGRVPRRVVIHKTTGFRNDELDGAADALEAVEEVDCIELTTNVAWRAVWLQASRRNNERSQPDRYPVPRGTMVPVSGTAALLWGAGNSPGVSSRGNFYQGGKSIPRPLLLTRHAGSGPLEIAGLEALALTKMDWNNDALYDPVPVTIRYSQLLARTIANVPSLPRAEYPYRLFM